MLQGDAAAAVSASLAAAPLKLKAEAAELSRRSMPSLLARPIVRSRAFTCAAAGLLLGGGNPAVAAASDTVLQLLVGSAGPGDGEGQLEVICEQQLFATVRALAVVPGGGLGSAGQVRPAYSCPSAGNFLQ